MTGILRCGRFRLALARPLVMGVVNVTPDSFYDGGRHADAQAAIAHARRLAEEGADLLDVGGESSRPGAAPVGADEELARILPVLEGIAELGLPASVDTTKPEVMRAALAAGAAMINDITALGTPGALEAVAAADAGVCLMHMQGSPRTMQADPQYADVTAEVRDFLAARAAACERAGITRDRIVLDPGFGFGKTLDHNLTLLARLREIAALGFPVLVGWSRKSSLGRITGRPAEERLAASAAAALIAVQRGARIVRVHDVAATRDVLAVLAAVEGAE
jgi:dihydropteroate synthase